MLEMTMTRLQMNLKFLGYYGGNIDGIKGNLTKQAIRRFRNEHGLGDSEIADQKMIDCIRTIICEEQKKYGATVDGVAGNETIRKKAEYENNNVQEYAWKNVSHFQKSEFACKCGCGFDDIDIRLVKLLEQIRSHFGGNPLIITSGCRCATHNRKVGGVQGSRHVLGKASDFYIKNVSKNNLLNYCKQLVAEGKARYTYTNNTNMSGVVHLDLN